MNIIYDNIIYNLQKAGGISLYWSELINYNHEKINHYITYTNAEKNVFFPSSYLEKKSQKLSIVERYINPKIEMSQPHIFHSSYYRTNKAKNALNITTIHDFTYEYFRFDIKSQAHKLQKKNAIKKSAGIICISENTEKDLYKFFPELKTPVKVIYNGFSEDFYIIHNTNKSNKILFIGSRAKYKQFNYAVEIIKKLTGYCLQIIGGGALTQEEIQMLEREIPQRYFFEGNVTNEKLNHIYNEAFCLLYPSLYEGFGIPIIEAQAAGCPVVCTPYSSLSEVGGNGALYINTKNMQEDIFIIKTLENADTYQHFQNSGKANSQRFSWKKCAEETFAFYQAIYQQSQH